MRPSEACALDWEHIDLDARTASVKQPYAEAS
jgi:integrase